jgi:hypothetical protein
MTQMTILPGGDKGVLASPQHLLLIAMRNGGGFIARGAGASRPQLIALMKAGYAKLTTEREGARIIVTGATLAPHGERHLELLDEALARKQHIEHIVAHGFGS